MQIKELYQSVTQQIITALESDQLPPWRKNWKGGASSSLPLRHNGQPYRGINTLILWITAEAMGYSSPVWMTFKQVLEYGGCVRKGEKSTAILYCEPIRTKQTADDGTESEEHRWISKVYRVFNAEQCNGMPDRFLIDQAPNLDPAQRIEHADAFIRNTGADIRHGAGGAFYRPSKDFINLPPFEMFDSPEAYYSTAIHELGHWTGHGTRLARELTDSTDRQGYAREEIIAELSSVFTCATLGIMPADIGEHAAYIQFWVKAMKQDHRYLFTAASKAQAAADFLHGLQPKV